MSFNITSDTEGEVSLTHRSSQNDGIIWILNQSSGAEGNIHGDIKVERTLAVFPAGWGSVETTAMITYTIYDSNLESDTLLLN
jgi:hypothetical protein